MAAPNILRQFTNQASGCGRLNIKFIDRQKEGALHTPCVN